MSQSNDCFGQVGRGRGSERTNVHESFNGGKLSDKSS